MEVTVIMYVLIDMSILFGAALGMWFLMSGLLLIGELFHYHDYVLLYFKLTTRVVPWLLGLLNWASFFILVFDSLD